MCGDQRGYASRPASDLSIVLHCGIQKDLEVFVWRPAGAAHDERGPIWPQPHVALLASKPLREQRQARPGAGARISAAVLSILDSVWIIRDAVSQLKTKSLADNGTIKA
jgi:hypothetical protein